MFFAQLKVGSALCLKNVNASVSISVKDGKTHVILHSTTTFFPIFDRWESERIPKAFALILQTNLQFNNNKYYLIQLLQDDSSKAYSVWSRWGRGEFTCPWFLTCECLHFCSLELTGLYSVHVGFFIVLSLVGKVGQSNLAPCGGDLLKAKDVFKKK